MIPGDILEIVFADLFGADFDIALYRSLPGATVSDYERYLNTTEGLIVKSMREKKVRGLLRVGQSDYVAIANVNTISTSWSIELADDIDNPKAFERINHIIEKHTEQIITIEGTDADGNPQDYSVALTFTAPTSLTSETINGTRYQSIVFSGAATITDKSALANETMIIIDGHEVKGLVSWAIGAASTGENYNTAGNFAALQNTAVQSVNTALSMEIHTIKSDPVSLMFTEALLAPELSIDEYGALKTYEIDITVGEKTTHYSDAKLTDVQTNGSIGSFVVLSLRFMRQ